MATARFVHDGDYVDHTPAADVAAGDVIVQGDLVGIAKGDIAAERLGAIAVVGVFDIAKDTAAAIPAGAKVYWDAANLQAVATATGNKLVGKAVAEAGAGTSEVRVRLSQ